MVLFTIALDDIMQLKVMYSILSKSYCYYGSHLVRKKDKITKNDEIQNKNYEIPQSKV